MAYLKIDVKDIYKHYEDPSRGRSKKDAAETRYVLNDLNLEIYNHEFICLLGHSGCGKSTLLNLIAGYIKPDKGSILLDGGTKTVTGPAADRAVVFQEHALFPWYTVEENIAFGPKVMKKRKEEIEQIVDKYISMIGLEEYRKAYPSQLSGGMKQRVGIARAFANNAGILLMDEPFSALDEFTRSTMQQELLKIWGADKNVTIVFITHSIEEAVLLADRVIVMAEGKIVSDEHITMDRQERNSSNPEYLAEVEKFRVMLQETNI